jgi:hypothetical protein
MELFVDHRLDVEDLGDLQAVSVLIQDAVAHLGLKTQCQIMAQRRYQKMPPIAAADLRDQLSYQASLAAASIICAVVGSAPFFGQTGSLLEARYLGRDLRVGSFQDNGIDIPNTYRLVDLYGFANGAIIVVYGHNLRSRVTRVWEEPAGDVATVHVKEARRRVLLAFPDFREVVESRIDAGHASSVAAREAEAIVFQAIDAV